MGDPLVTTVGENKFEYSITDTGNACLELCHANERSLVVPDSLDGHTITSLSAHAFDRCFNVRSLVLPAGLDNVEGRPFFHCPMLSELVFPESMSEFDASCLGGIRKLDLLVLPGQLVTLKGGLFATCKISTLRLGKATTNIAEMAFNNSTLTKVEVDPSNDNLETDGIAIYRKTQKTLVAQAVKVEEYAIQRGTLGIERKAFAYDDLLRKVDFPETLEFIGEFAFANSKIEIFDAPDCLRRIEEKAFYRCSNLKEAKFNVSIEQIGNSAFEHTAIEEVYIPASVKAIGLGAFAHTRIPFSTDVARFSIDPNNDRFEYDGHGGLYFIDGPIRLFHNLLDSNVTSFSIAPGTYGIGNNAFQNHTRIRHVTLPEGLKSIGAHAFQSCRNLQTVDFPESLEYIGERAFYESSLESLRIPAGFKLLGKEALATLGGHALGQPSLSRIDVDPNCENYTINSGMLLEHLPDGFYKVVIYVGPEENIYFTNDIKRIESYAFYGATTVRSFSFHDRFDEIGFAALFVQPPVEKIELRLSEPIAGNDSFVFDFPADKDPQAAIVNMLKIGNIKLESLFYCHDYVTMMVLDNYIRGKKLLERLTHPFLLADDNEYQIRRLIRLRLLEISVAFAQADYYKGFDRLADQGFLNSDNVTDIIDVVNSSGNVAATGYLLNMKKSRLSGDIFDFGL